MAAIEIEEGSPDADAEMHRPLQVSIEAHAAMFEIDLQNLIRSANLRQPPLGSTELGLMSIRY